MAAELARDSLVALVPCKEMARGSGALGSCTEVARDSVVALWSAAWNSRVGAFRKSSTRLVSEKWETRCDSVFYLLFLWTWYHVVILNLGALI